MKNKNIRMTIVTDPELHHKVKIAAALGNVTLNEFFLSSVRGEIAKMERKHPQLFAK